MKTKGLLIASLLVVVVMVAFAFYTASLLPEGAQLPTRFDAEGNVLRSGDARPVLLIRAVILLVGSLVFAAIPHIEPLQDRLEGSAPLLTVAWIGMLILMPLTQLVSAAPAYGWDLPVGLTISGVGVLLVVMGNWLPKSRPGFFVGIRTPWTITDTDVWIATHRLGGKLFMAAGAIMAIVPFLPLLPGVRVILTVVAILVATLVPVVYSFLLWRKKKNAARTNGG